MRTCKRKKLELDLPGLFRIHFLKPDSHGSRIYLENGCQFAFGLNSRRGRKGWRISHRRELKKRAYRLPNQSGRKQQASYRAIGLPFPPATVISPRLSDGSNVPISAQNLPCFEV